MRVYKTEGRSPPNSYAVGYLATSPLGGRLRGTLERGLSRMILRVLAAVAAALLLSSDSSAQDRQWRWFIALSFPNDWRTERGVADVQMADRVFTARLLKDSVAAYEIKGTRDGVSLRAKLAGNESDLVDFPLRGTYTRTARGDAPETEFEQIILWGDRTVVGLIRDIPKRSNPGVQRPPASGRH